MKCREREENLVEDVTREVGKAKTCCCSIKIYLLFPHQQQWAAKVEFNLGEKIMIKVILEKIPPALKNGMEMGQD